MRDVSQDLTAHVVDQHDLRNTGKRTGFVPLSGVHLGEKLEVESSLMLKITRAIANTCVQSEGADRLTRALLFVVCGVTGWSCVNLRTS